MHCNFFYCWDLFLVITNGLLFDWKSVTLFTFCTGAITIYNFINNIKIQLNNMNDMKQKNLNKKILKKNMKHIITIGARAILDCANIE